MGFRILSDERRTIVRDVSPVSTIIGMVFVSAGLFVLGALHGESWSRFALRERLGVLFIVLVHLWVGCWLVWRRLDTTTTFDHATGEGVHVVRRPYFGEPTVTRFKLEEVRTIEVVQSKDSEGDATYQLVLWLDRSRRLPLQMPANGLARAETSQARLAGELGLAHAVALGSIRT